MITVSFFTSISIDQMEIKFWKKNHLKMGFCLIEIFLPFQCNAAISRCPDKNISLWLLLDYSIRSKWQCHRHQFKMHAGGRCQLWSFKAVWSEDTCVLEQYVRVLFCTVCCNRKAHNIKRHNLHYGQRVNYAKGRGGLKYFNALITIKSFW